MFGAFPHIADFAQNLSLTVRYVAGFLTALLQHSVMSMSLPLLVKHTSHDSSVMLSQILWSVI